MSRCPWSIEIVPGTVVQCVRDIYHIEFELWHVANTAGGGGRVFHIWKPGHPQEFRHAVEQVT